MSVLVTGFFIRPGATSSAYKVRKMSAYPDSGLDPIHGTGEVDIHETLSGWIRLEGFWDFLNENPHLKVE
jgi:hypothetical protein